MSAPSWRELNSHERFGLRPRTATPPCTPPPSCSHRNTPGERAKLWRWLLVARFTSASPRFTDSVFFPTSTAVRVTSASGLAANTGLPVTRTAPSRTATESDTGAETLSWRAAWARSGAGKARASATSSVAQRATHRGVGCERRTGEGIEGAGVSRRRIGGSADWWRLVENCSQPVREGEYPPAGIPSRLLGIKSLRLTGESAGVTSRRGCARPQRCVVRWVVRWVVRADSRVVRPAPKRVALAVNADVFGGRERPGRTKPTPPTPRSPRCRGASRLLKWRRARRQSTHERRARCAAAGTELTPARGRLY